MSIPLSLTRTLCRVFFCFDIMRCSDRLQTRIAPRLLDPRSIHPQLVFSVRHQILVNEVFTARFSLVSTSVNDDWLAESR
jgi:hypothetical protein